MKFLQMLNALIHSRKFWAVILGVAGVIASELSLDQQKAQWINSAIIGLSGMFIHATGKEDAAAKAAGNFPPEPPPLSNVPAVGFNSEINT